MTAPQISIAFGAAILAVAIPSMLVSRHAPAPTARDLKLQAINEQVAEAQAASDARDRAERERTPEQVRDERAAHAIPLHKVFIGMTEDQARQSWGTPDRVMRSTTAAPVQRTGSMAKRATAASSSSMAFCK